MGISAGDPTAILAAAQIAFGQSVEAGAAARGASELQIRQASARQRQSEAFINSTLRAAELAERVRENNKATPPKLIRSSDEAAFFVMPSPDGGPPSILRVPLPGIEAKDPDRVILEWPDPERPGMVRDAFVTKGTLEFQSFVPDAVSRFPSNLQTIPELSDTGATTAEGKRLFVRQALDASTGVVVPLNMVPFTIEDEDSVSGFFPETRQIAIMRGAMRATILEQFGESGVKAADFDELFKPGVDESIGLGQVFAMLSQKELTPEQIADVVRITRARLSTFGFIPGPNGLVTGPNGELTAPLGNMLEPRFVEVFLPQGEAPQNGSVASRAAQKLPLARQVSEPMQEAIRNLAPDQRIAFLTNQIAIRKEKNDGTLSESDAAQMDAMGRFIEELSDASQ